MSEKKTLQEALAKALDEAEASNAQAAKKRTQAVPEQLAEAVRLTAIQARLEALPLAQRRQVLDAAGLKHVPAGPVPITALRGGALVSTPPREKPVSSVRLPKGAINWDLWRAMPTVKLWQACALVVGLNPEKLFFEFGEVRFKGWLPTQTERRQLGNAMLLGSSAVSYMHGPIYPRGSLQVGANKAQYDVVLADVVAFFMNSRAGFNVPIELQGLAPHLEALQMQGLKTPPQTEKVETSPLPVESVREPRPMADAPMFSMNRAGLIAAHKHEWPTIEADLKYASENGLATAKAGPRDWNETRAMDWARARGKLTSESKPANDLASAVHSMSKLPGRKHTLEG